MALHDRSLDKQTLQHFWDVSRTFKRDFYLTGFITVQAICFATILPFIIGHILSELVKPQHDVTALVVTFIIVSVICVITNRIGYIAFLRLQPNVMTKLFNECYDKMLKRGSSYHNNQISGKLISDTIDYPAAYSQLSGAFVIDIIPFILGVITGLIVIFFNSVPLGLLMLAMTVVAVGTGISLRKRMMPHRVKRIAARKAMIGHLSDSITNIAAVKHFAREQLELETHEKLADTLRQRQIHDWRIVAIDGTNRITYLLLFEIVFIAVIIWLVNRDPTLLATGIFAFSYTVTLSNRLFSIGAMVRNIEESLLQAEPMAAALKEPDEIVDKPDAKRLGMAAGSAINFQAVTFHYNDASTDDVIFKNLNLSIAAGERVGLVGPSGGGKSTLTKLLLRLEDIQSGSITIGAEDISQVAQQSLRSAIAYVPQESLLFHRTISDNIAYGNPKATMAEIEVAAQRAYAADFIAQLPQGYDTVVGERGVKLSGGQRQRVAIARAILKDAPILVLDEATSALDSESEEYIQAALWELMKDRTALVIAHRLSTIQKLDRIIVLANGTVAEDGSHENLLKKNGLYASLWRKQSGGFIED